MRSVVVEKLNEVRTFGVKLKDKGISSIRRESMERVVEGKIYTTQTIEVVTNLDALKVTVALAKGYWGAHYDQSGQMDGFIFKPLEGVKCEEIRIALLEQ